MADRPAHDTLAKALREWVRTRARLFGALYDPDQAYAISDSHAWSVEFKAADDELFRLASRGSSPETEWRNDHRSSDGSYDAETWGGSSPATDLEHQSERRAYWRERAERAEAQLAASPSVPLLAETLAFYAERRNYRTAAGEPACKQHLGNTCGMEHRDSFDGEGPGARARAALASSQVDETTKDRT